MKIYKGILTITKDNQNDFFDFEVLDGDLIIFTDVNVSLPKLKQINGCIIIYNGTNVILNDLQIVHGCIYLFTYNYEYSSCNNTCLTVLNLVKVYHVELYSKTILLVKNSKVLKDLNITYMTQNETLVKGEVITPKDFKIFKKKYFNQ